MSRTAFRSHRPPIPEYVAIEAALGEEVYAAVFEGKPPREALAAVEQIVTQTLRDR